jgi:hypothetical protein
MANKIKPRRSYTASSVPLTSDLDTHELAINWVDGKAFTKDASGNIVSVTLGGGSYTLPTASSSTLGGVRVGSGLSISSGVLSASDSRWDLFLPPAPTGLTAIGGNGQATLSWTAPTGVIAQAPVSDYVVQLSSNSGSSWTTFSDGTSTSTSATVTGLTNGTAYTFRVAAVNGIGTGAYSAASAAVTPSVPTDGYFSSVSLLLHADGNGSSFVDSSASPKTLTAYGNATHSSTQSKFGGKSLYLDGSGDYLQTASNAAFGFGTGDFTIEYWHYPLQNSGNETLIDTRPSDTAAWLVLGKSSGGAVRCYDGSSVRTGGSMSLNAWNHIAWVRSSGVNTLYLNGTSVITFTNANDAGSSRGLTIGSNVLTSAENTYGYIDDLRITKGVARTITVPTAAYPDS